jgi:dimethylaniline monooxygenase (N-oxide forming)
VGVYGRCIDDQRASQLVYQLPRTCAILAKKIPGTRALISKYTCGMSDFPMPDSTAHQIYISPPHNILTSYLEYPDHLSQAEFQEFLESYAANYDMHKDIVFNALVKQVSRNKDDSQWRLDLVVNGESQIKEYDKVAFCHGYQTKANMPDLDGVEKFKGVVMHSQQFRM